LTKSRGIGRGGKRPNAGRKPKAGALKAAPEKSGNGQKQTGVATPPPAAPADDARDWVKDPPQTALELEGLALATLRHIMEQSPNDSARKSAASEVLVRARQEKLAGGVLGKKAQQQAKVDEIGKPGGRFALRQGPAWKQ
jgi:hypothetical protein